MLLMESINLSWRERSDCDLGHKHELSVQRTKIGAESPTRVR